MSFRPTFGSNTYYTSNEYVMEYIQWHHNTSFGLIYTTNERNASYLNNLHENMRRVNAHSVFLDDALKKWCPDNFCTYCAHLQLVARAHQAFKLGKH